VNQVYKMPLTLSIATALLEEVKRVDLIFHLLDPQLTHIDEVTIHALKTREELRATKEFAAADAIRMEIQKQYVFEDDKTGFSLVPRVFVSTPSGGAGATV
jgi:cysteinyl-tRNA synthetase